MTPVKKRLMLVAQLDRAGLALRSGRSQHPTGKGAPQSQSSTRSLMGLKPCPPIALAKLH